MASIYQRGNYWWITWLDEDGKKQAKSTGARIAEKTRALAIQKELEKEVERAKRAKERRARAEKAILAKIDARTSKGSGVLTFGAFVKDKWWPKRKRNVKDWTNDESKLRVHILPVLGDMPISAIKYDHIASVIERLRDSGKSRATQVNVYSVIRAIYRDIIKRNLIHRQDNPCVLDKDDFDPPPMVDNRAREKKVLSKAEVVTLLTSESVYWDRRYLYAITYLGGGLRLGEVAGLTWGQYDTSTVPLGRLSIDRSYDSLGNKTGVVREIPVHPTLALVLAELRDVVWPREIGRAPTPSDLIIPVFKSKWTKRPIGEIRTKNSIDKGFWQDLAKLGMDHRTFHSWRNTYITHARQDGVRTEILELWTHPKTTNRMVDRYTVPEWPAICGECVKLDFSAALVPTLAPTVALTSENHSTKSVEAPGVENGYDFNGLHLVSSNFHENQEVGGSGGGNAMKRKAEDCRSDGKRTKKPDIVKEFVSGGIQQALELLECSKPEEAKTVLSLLLSIIGP